MRVLNPQGMVRDRLDFARGLQHPAFAPSIDNTVLAGRVGQECERKFENYRIAILSSPGVLARIDKPKVAVHVSLEAIAVPGQWTRRQISLGPVSPIRLCRIVVEQVVAFEFEKGLRDL